MPRLGKYCKAYPVKRLKQFSTWTSQVAYQKNEKTLVDDRETEIARELKDNDYLFLQEDYRVTDGIFLDQNIVFDQVTPEWKEFCQKELGFMISASAE